jgi:hypothetical protein
VAGSGSCRGGALVKDSRREPVERVRLGVADFMAALASSPGNPVRRLTRRPTTRSSGGGAVQRRARRGAGELGFAGPARTL